MSANLLAKDYKSDVKPIWCPRCGDFGFLSALYKTFEELQIKPHETVVVSGIGCAGRTPAFIKTYGFHGAHGRLLPIAMGIKLANPALKVIGVTGDDLVAEHLRPVFTGQVGIDQRRLFL